MQFWLKLCCKFNCITIVIVAQFLLHCNFYCVAILIAFWFQLCRNFNSVVILIASRLLSVGSLHEHIKVMFCTDSHDIASWKLIIERLIDDVHVVECIPQLPQDHCCLVHRFLMHMIHRFLRGVLSFGYVVISKGTSWRLMVTDC